MFYCNAHWWLNRRTPTSHRSKPNARPAPLVVIQNGTFLFVIHAYSARQARTLVAARLADTTGVLIVAPREGSPR
jgi:hypothetical protein